MMLGTYTSNLTSGKRVAVPKKFRGEVGDDFVVARWYEGCLVLVSKDKWIELLNKLTGRSQVITAPVRDTDRFVMGSAYELGVDSQGRMVLPDALLDYAELTSEVLFVGLGDRVEIWSKENWQKREAYLAENAAQLVEKLAREQKEGL